MTNSVRRILRSVAWQALVLALIVGLSADTLAQGSSFKIIVNQSNEIESISKSDLSKIFMKNLTKWEGSNLAIAPVELLPNSSVRREFSKSVHDKSVSAVKAHWTKRIFSGKGVPPAELENDSAVIAHVKSTPGAIGYVSSNASVSGVKVVSIGSTRYAR